MSFLKLKHQEGRESDERTGGSDDYCAGRLICIASNLIGQDKTADGGRCGAHDQNHLQFGSRKPNAQSDYPTCDWAGRVFDNACCKQFAPFASHGNRSQLATNANECD